MTLREQYENSPSVAYNYGFGGIEIKDILYDIDDYVVFVAGTLTSNPKIHKSKIYNNGDRAFFKYNGQRIYLDECMRV